jgi:hypothetical protein
MFEEITKGQYIKYLLKLYTYIIHNFLDYIPREKNSTACNGYSSETEIPTLSLKNNITLILQHPFLFIGDLL